MKTFSFLCMIATSALLFCCNCTYGRIPRKLKKIPVVEKVMNIHVDDSVKHFLGDSISRVIFEPDTVKLFSLSVKPITADSSAVPVQGDSIPRPNFHGCYINHDYGVLQKSEVYPILLILSDRDNYLQDSVRLKSPFTPSVALSFKKEGKLVEIVFSFTGGQMFIFLENGEKLYFKYTYERLTMKYFQSFLKDERITKFLNLYPPNYENR